MKKPVLTRILSASNRQKSKNFYLFICQEKNNDIHTDMQCIIKMLFKDERDVNFK